MTVAFVHAETLVRRGAEETCQVSPSSPPAARFTAARRRTIYSFFGEGEKINWYEAILSAILETRAEIK